MTERRSKRPKITRGEDDYMPGNIIEIELSNFMTFSKLRSKPGSRLNLVIGPNGSGKSSLVCAIALGLGGDPQVLGRATSIGAYVKRGEEFGYIKISLRGYEKDERIIIKRKIDTHNKSEWLLNDKAVAKKEIIEVIQKFNIQVTNLTQFLPQDRVCEFARLTPIQLLDETEKAIGDPQLSVQHRALISRSQELKKIERAVQSNSESLSQLKAVNAELETDVQRVRQRDDLLKQAEKMREKLPWLMYDIKKNEYTDAQDQEKEAKKKFEEAAKVLHKLKKPLEKQKQEKAMIDATSKEILRLLDGNMKKRINILEDENRLTGNLRGKHKDIEELRRQEESHQRRLSEAKEDLASAELELANFTPVQHPKDKLDGFSAQMLELQETARELRTHRSNIEKQLAQCEQVKRQCVDRVKNMESTSNKLLEALRRNGADKIFEAFEWVREHRHQFKQEVYGPVLLEVNVSNRRHADYIEGHVANYIWKAFITQDPSDRDLLVENLRPFGLPIINYVRDEGSQKTPFQITEEMRMLGIYSRLDQIFEAPHAVKEVLINQFGLECSYIGSEESDRRADEVNKLGIMDLWTPQNHFRWSRSRYGGHVSATVESVDNSRLFQSCVDVGEIERLKSRIRELDENIYGLGENMKALQGEIRTVEDQEAHLHKQREKIVTDLQQKRKMYRELERRVDMRKSKLKSIVEEESWDIRMQKLFDQVEEMKVQRLQLATTMKELLIEAVAHRRNYAEYNMASIEIEAKIKGMEGNMKQQSKFAEEASLNLDYCKKEVSRIRLQLESAFEEANSVAKLTPERQQAFLEMPTTIEELEAAISDLISQANSILFLNQNILEEYERRQRKIEELTRNQEAATKDLQSCLDEIDSMKGQWLPSLRTLVTQINETFSHNFQEMAVAGEVTLDERGVDFDQYGILIKVKFREAGQLQVLSAFHQSGGERSVSTILYLVSLQDLTTCPFRVVDEINQGMDPINERKMFQQLVRAASKPNTPQCFLLTPKLLPSLEYSESCSILTVMNGPWIEQPSEVWSSGENWGSVLGLVAGNN